MRYFSKYDKIAIKKENKVAMKYRKCKIYIGSIVEYFFNFFFDVVNAPLTYTVKCFRYFMII